METISFTFTKFLFTFSNNIGLTVIFHIFTFQDYTTKQTFKYSFSTLHLCQPISNWTIDYQLFSKSTTKTTLQSFVYRAKSSVSSTTTGLMWPPVSSTGNSISFAAVSPLLDTSAWRTCTNTIVIALTPSYMQLHYVAIQLTTVLEKLSHISNFINSNIM